MSPVTKNRLNEKNRGFFADGSFKFNIFGQDYKLGQIIMTKSHLYRVGHNVEKDFKLDWRNITRIYKLPKYEEPGKYIIPERIVILANDYQTPTIEFSNDLKTTCDYSRSYFLHNKHVGDLDNAFEDIRYYYNDSVIELYKNVRNMYSLTKPIEASISYYGDGSRKVIYSNRCYPPPVYRKQQFAGGNESCGVVYPKQDVVMEEVD